MTCLAVGMACGFILNSSSPIPSRTGIARDSPANSPCRREAAPVARCLSQRGSGTMCRAMSSREATALLRTRRPTACLERLLLNLSAAISSSSQASVSERSHMRSCCRSGASGSSSSPGDRPAPPHTPSLPPRTVHKASCCTSLRKDARSPDGSRRAIFPSFARKLNI
jgi:hypothetical protein